MFLRARNLRSNVVRLLTGFGLLMAALTSQLAFAAPPSINGGPIPIGLTQTQGEGNNVTVNLRQLGAIAGSAPIFVSSVRFLIDGNPEPNDLIRASFFEGSSGPGNVCIVITNVDYAISPEETYELDLTVTNLRQQSASGRVRILDTPGPTVGPNDIATCGDPNSSPKASAGGNRTIQDSDGRPGETVTLDGSNSVDNESALADLTFEWFVNNVSQGEPSSSPTLDVTLDDGANEVRLEVTDDSGDFNSNRGSDIVQITVIEPVAGPLVANAGPDRTLSDTDGLPGEDVELDASASTGDNITGYEWFVGQQSLGRSEEPTLQTRLPDGVNTIRLVVRASDGESSFTETDTVQITVTAPVPLTADAGTDQTLNDTDGVAGENVTLDGSNSSGNITAFEWSLGDVVLGTTQVLPTRLPDGVNTVTLTVSYDTGDGVITDSDTVQITVNAPAAPTANAGVDRTVADSNFLPGETVTLDGSASSTPTGSITAYNWYRQTGPESREPLGSGVTITATLPDGINTVILEVTNSAQLTSSDSVQITVTQAAAAPVANAGADRAIADSDLQPGETVTLDGSASSTPQGTITTYNWYRQTGSESRELLGSGVTISVELPDGVNTITLEVTNSAGRTASDAAQITVAAPPERTVLSELPNLSPNQRKMAAALDDVCGRMLDDESDDTVQPSAARPAASAARAPTEAEVADLTAKCRGLLFNNTAANQADALDELNGDDFAAARTQTLLFANFQYAGVMDRLMALRGGARGLSLAGLNIMVDGQMVPLATLQKMVGDLLGGGAASDADEAGGLLSDKWGMWMRGNYSFGEKDASASSPRFEADQFAIVSGIDYRLSEKAVLGGSLAYGNSSVEFRPIGEGSLDSESWAASLYGSVYAARNFYFDAVFNVADSKYDANRNITYVDGTGLVTADARGDTGGLTLSGGISGGYDFLVGGLTVSPNIGFFYVDATIDGFTERGAVGLNLIYDEQQFESLTSNLGLRATYAWNLSWGVLMPHVRVDYVREYEDDVDVFGVRFAADPNATSTPPILVETENPDTSYWRLSGGFSAQFPHGISGYVEYQRLQSFQFITFQDISFGLRMQKSF